MMKRKRRIFPTREAYLAWLHAREERERELRGHAERIRLELEAKKHPSA
jgi:hypothetical protein